MNLFTIFKEKNMENLFNIENFGTFDYILAIVCIIAVWILYNKIVQPVFITTTGCAFQLIASLFGGTLVYGLLRYFFVKAWWLILIIAVLIIIGVIKNNE